MDAFAHAADLFDPPKHPLARYFRDPVGFAQDCIAWKPGEGVTAYQEREMRALVEHGRVAVRAPHGAGKTSSKAWLMLWFALSRDAVGLEWKIPTTAGAWRQLTHYLWPEIHKWARRLRWDRIGRGPFTKYELLALNLKLEHGEAFAVACSDPATIEGAHAEQILYVYDEAKLIPAATFDASEGAFSGAGEDTGAEAFALASSTPGEPSGRFYDICSRKPGLEDWHSVHVTKDEVVAAGRMSKDWAVQRARQWGEDSAVYQNRVLGEFAAADETSVIPLAWVEAANERWHAWKDGRVQLGPLTAIGVDVGGGGKAKTVFAPRHGPVVVELVRRAEPDPVVNANALAPMLVGDSYAVVDVVGIGAGVVGKLRELGCPVVPFSAGERTDRRDAASGEIGYADTRAAAWWALRELLDPAWGSDIALPPDDLLTGDLTAPKWVMTSRGIRVESKLDVAKRLGRSTDDGDAVVQSFWQPDVPQAREVWTAEDVLGEELYRSISPY